MKRKILSAFISLAMLCSMTAVPASAKNTDTETDAAMYEAAVEEIAEEAEQDDGFKVSLFSSAPDLGANLTYELDSAGTITISGTGDMVFVGGSYYHTPWAETNSSIKKVVIEEGVTSIAKEAFYCCTNLESVELPSTLTKIDEKAFDYCQNLKSITIPDGVSAIGSSAFEDCIALISVKLSSSLTSISSRAFYDCSALTSIEIPSGVTAIESNAFNGCKKLASVTIQSESELASIGASAFYRCSVLKGIALPDSVTSIGSGAFADCAELEAITMSKNITSIGASAFYECSKLKAIELPEGLKTIDSKAFESCYALSSIKIPGTVETFGERVFYSCSSLTFVVVDEGVRSLGEDMFYFCRAMTSVTLPQTLETVGKSAFQTCSSLANVYYTGSKAKWNTITITDYNTNLTNAAIRYNTIRDGDLRYYFIGADNDILKVDCLTASANTISPDALKDNTKIRAVLIPARVLVIGANAFSGCENIEKVYYTEGADDWEELDIGEGNEALTGAVLFPNAKQNGDNVIYRYTDADKTSLLMSGSGLMPEYTASNSIWRDNKTITNVAFEERVTSVGSYIFYNWTALKSVTLSDKIASIGKGAFSGCSALTEITIPASVTEIKEDAFRGCSSLKEIYFMGTKSQWKELMANTASDNDVLTANGVTVHYEVKNLGDFKWWIAEGDILEVAGTGVIPSFTEENPAPWGTGIKGVIIPSTVKGIGANAFSGCENLNKVYYKADGISWKEIDIDEGNDAISSATVYYNAMREDNIIWTFSNNKDAVLTISGAGAIKDYTGKDYTGKTYTASWAKHAANAKKIVIEDNITTAGVNAFKGFTEVISVIIPEGMTEIHESAFEGCSALADAVLPSTVEYIDKNAFKGTAITSVTIPEGITELPYGVFERCAKLSQVTLPESLTTIDECAFKNCSSLRSIDIPDTVTSIGEFAFENCAMLQKIIIPAGTQNLSASVFSGCKNLETVIAHEKLKSIGNKAFYGCDKLTDVYYAGKEEEWGFITMDNDNDALINAEMHYDYTVITSTTYKVDEITPTETGVTFTVQTNRMVSGEQTAMIACYDENGVFIGLKEQQITASDTEQDISVDIDKTEVKTVKAFIWNAMDYMMPASRPKSIEL